jgi:hypothetical protein
MPGLVHVKATGITHRFFGKAKFYCAVCVRDLDFLHTHYTVHTRVYVCAVFSGLRLHVIFSHSCQILHKIQLELKTVFGRMDLITANR